MMTSLDDDSISVTMSVQSGPRTPHREPPAAQKFAVNPKRKTELCRNIIELGWCQYGSRCQFAHDKSELRDASHLRGKAKNKLCRAFWESGVCSYGTRCRFLHAPPLTAPLPILPVPVTPDTPPFHHRLPVFEAIAPDSPMSVASTPSTTPVPFSLYSPPLGPSYTSPPLSPVSCCVRSPCSTSSSPRCDGDRCATPPYLVLNSSNTPTLAVGSGLGPME